jgi:hypothetical protein
MNELKKHLNENVFAQNPFNDQIKQRMIKNVLKSGEVKHKKKGPLIALISAACIVLFFAITALEAPGFFQLGTSASGLEQLQEQHPDMKKELDKLSPGFHDNIKLPTYFPFKIKKQSVNVTSEDKAKEMSLPESAHFFYGNDGKQFINVDMLYFPQDAEGGFHSSAKSVKLADGTKAYLTMNKNAHIIGWFDKKAHIEYSIWIMTKGKNPYTKEVLLKMANSMR